MYDLIKGPEEEKERDDVRHQDINQSIFWESMKNGRVDSVVSHRSLPQFNNLFDESSI
jgi:hypothetical protein